MVISTNPVPFDRLPADCDVTVAVDVTGKPVRGGRKHPTNAQLVVGSMLTLFHQIAKLRRERNPPDIYIEPNVDPFQAPDFFKIDEILQAAEPAKEQLKQVLAERLSDPA